MDHHFLLQKGSKDQRYFEERPPLWKQWHLFRKALPWILNLLLGAAVVWMLVEKHQPTKHRDQEVFSPVQYAIEYETRVFTSAFGSNKSKYQGPPSEAVDKAWDELYNAVGISRIDKESAMQLPNKTVQIPGDPGQYIVGIDVFHQLHCLNHLRMLIWPDTYHMLEQDANDPEKHQSHIDHFDHCVDMLRQSLMCHSDISTLYWEWIPETGRSLARAETTHTCRNFDKIWDWAKDHELQAPFDSYIHVEEDEEE